MHWSSEIECMEAEQTAVSHYVGDARSSLPVAQGSTRERCVELADRTFVGTDASVVCEGAYAVTGSAAQLLPITDELKRNVPLGADVCEHARTLYREIGAQSSSDVVVGGIRSSIPLTHFSYSAQANRNQKLKRTQAVQRTQSAAFRHDLTPGRLENGTTLWHARDGECRRSATYLRQTPPGATPPGGEEHGATDDSRAIALHDSRDHGAAFVWTDHVVRPDRSWRACQGASGRISEGAGGIGARTGGAQGGRGNGGAVAASCASRNGAPARNALMPTGDSARLCRASPRDRRCAR
jgi:hypothetical protein